MDQDVTWYGARPRPRRLCVKCTFGLKTVAQKLFALCYRTVVLFVCNVSVLWPNGWMDQDEAWSELGLGPGQKFSAHVYCGQTAGWMKLVLGMEVGLSPGDFVLDGDPVPFPQKGVMPSPQYSAHFYCGQTARCIKMPFGMDVGLSPGDFVLDRDPVLPPNKGAEPHPQFSAHFYCAQTVGCIKMPLGMEVGLSPGDFVLDEDLRPSPKRGVAPNFRPMFIVAKCMDGLRCHLIWRQASAQMTLC